MNADCNLTSRMCAALDISITSSPARSRSASSESQASSHLAIAALTEQLDRMTDADLQPELESQHVLSCGLTNVTGVSCFMNAAWQVLVHLPELRPLFDVVPIEGDFCNFCCNSCSLCALAQLRMDMMASEGPVAPAVLTSLLPFQSKDLSAYQQQDAAEYLMVFCMNEGGLLPLQP